MKKFLLLSFSCFFSCITFAQTLQTQDIYFTNPFTGIHFRKDNNTRWYLRHDDAESGSNTGSNFSLYSYADNGTSLRQNISINRATGLMTVDGDLTTQAITGKTLTFKEADYVAMLGQGISITSGWNSIPDAYTITYFKRDFAIGGWRKSDGAWNGAALFINSNTGNVLIGKVTQANDTYKLDVAGKIRADKVVVNTTGADFVFDPGYDLIPLPALGKYIAEHRHLPGIRSAAEMQKEGLDVGENQTKLLQKIEELTLYIIELSRKVTEQEKMINALEKRK